MSERDTVRAREPSAAVRAEAAAWIARMHGPQRSLELEQGLRRWLAENADNAQAFERMTEAWEAATALAATSRFPRRATWKRPIAAIRLQAVGIAVACVVAALGVYVGYAAWKHPAYATGIGEQRMVRLDDGSRVSLNSASRVVVDYERSQRRVRLEHGEALFEVVSNPQRPFVVVAGDREVTALGTTFLVRYEPDRLAVVLVDGRVTVSAPPEDAAANNMQQALAKRVAASLSLTPGQRLILAATQPPQVDMPHVEAVTAWRRGEVVLEKTALVDAVAEMNRYDETRLVIDDPSIANLLVSGIYRTGDTAGFARAVGKMYGLTVAEEADSIHLRRTHGTQPSARR
jgi:transmembrane sensor